MKNICVSAIAILLAMAAINGAKADELICDNPVTTVDIKQCQSQELGIADNELNRVYHALRADQDDVANELLKSAQRSWIAYRDSECARLADSARGGTMAGIIELGCHIDLTKTRTEELAKHPITGEIRY